MMERHEPRPQPPRPRDLLPRGEVARPPLRRRLLRRRAHHRHLLPALVPGPHARRFANVSFHASPASAQAAGYRACKRCLPDATPGSPDWDVAADVAGRAMRLIADGVVDREGVDGLARAGGLHPAPPGPGAHRRARRRAAGAGPRQARPDRAGADRDHRPRLRRRRLRRRASPACGSSTRRCARSTPPARPTCAGAGGGRRGRRARSRCGWPCARRSPAGRCSTSSPTTWCRASRSGRRRGWYARTLDLPHGPGTVRLDIADALERGPDGVRHGRPSRSPTCATPPPPSSGPAACSTPTATRSRSPTTSPATR